MKRLVGILVCALISVTLGCSDQDVSSAEDSPSSINNSDNTTQIRQTDDNGKPLPFTNKFGKRWNSSNDGTTYESCTSVTESTAISQGLDPASVKDAATVNGQTLRGCAWKFADPEMRNWSAHQMVADFSGLEQYRRDNSFFEWFPDSQISGRTVGIASLNAGDCFTYVQSMGSGVITGITVGSLPKPPLTEICQRAIDLTKATIDKIPE
ncbi:DUF3558 family protein [Gordonia mangrovi]|uniref:DUF3558 family protein n=1 Tax=Gordonia mangrovi TaxID=2665643 RepID=UPI001368C209|nr:DUF3558 family protein [Gordonia mangrovi]UVF77638.1 DUF3558 domain-containing protein [Gordonia mangrovi]